MSVDITVTGTGFTEESVVRCDGDDIATVFVSETELIATVPDSKLDVAGARPITVFNPTPVGGTSDSVDFTVENPVPAITALSPTDIDEDEAGFTLTITGTGFVSDSVANWAGSARVTTFISATELEMAVLTADLVSSGDIDITVTNPTPGGGTSTAESFAVNDTGLNDDYFANVVALLHFEGADGSTTITDVVGKTWTLHGAAAIGTGEFKFGTASLFDQTLAAYVDTASHADFGYGTGDFTIEFWARPTSISGTQIVYDQRTSANQPRPALYMSGGSLFYYVSGGNRISGPSLSVNTWYHIAISRVSGSTRLFIDGVQSGSTYTDATDYEASRVELGVAGNTGTGEGFIGYTDELRITKGVGRYTTTFTPPAAAFPNA